MRRWVKMFQPRFEPLIVAVRKVSTIRRLPKRLEDWPEPGDLLDARMWTGAPYRSKQEKIGEFRVTSVHLFALLAPEYAWMDHIEHVDQRTLAREDGFRTWPDLVNWFEEHHGLPFIGIRIGWEGVD